MEESVGEVKMSTLWEKIGGEGWKEGERCRRRWNEEEGMGRKKGRKEGGGGELGKGGMGVRRKREEGRREGRGE